LLSINGKKSVSRYSITALWFRVETVFLGINHNIPGIEPPLWFESMVFRESADATHGVRIKYDTLRYSTVADAVAGHLSICEKVKGGEIGE